MSQVLTSHSLEYLMTMPLHCLLYSEMPIFATSSGPLIPKVLSISYSYINTKNMRTINSQKMNLSIYTVLLIKIITVIRITDTHHRQAMTIPTKASFHMEAALVGKASNNVLYGAG